MKIPSFPFSSILITLLLFASNPWPVKSATHKNITDLSALLAFKANVGDPLGILVSNWTTNTSFCSWVGVYCSRRRQRVTALKLDGFSLHGTISPHLANLSFLHYLDLTNNTLVGPIPDVIGRLSRLSNLTLNRNQLSGPIPPAILNMSSLTFLALAGNNLSGTLPQQNHSIILPQLRFINFADNQLNGKIPPSFAMCRELHEFSLSKNNFSGPIPAELGSLPELSGLYLNFNQFTGMIPTTLINLTKLNTLNLNYNRLQGRIPSELGSLKNLQYLLISNNSLTGPIPISLCNASMLSLLQISFNELTGSVPIQLGSNAPLLKWFNLEYNRLHGGLDFITSLSNCRALEYIVLSANNLDGVLPDSVRNLSRHLTVFTARHNRIKGEIPAGVANLSSLTCLTLDYNDLTGAIPPSLARMQLLRVLGLSYNRLDGSIPHELGLMRKLFYLYLYANNLVGSIPDSIGNNSQLQHLALSINGLSSAIPQSIWNLTDLITLDLSRNSLDGSLPMEVGNLKSMEYLDLSSNHLSGIIPFALGGMNMITYLNVSHNSFQGLIPQSFGGLININDMDISYNALAGSIPESLADLHYLNTLNLSHNRLEGKVPEGGIFLNLTIQSLIGNPALCGFPRLGFPPCSINSTISDLRARKHLLKLILLIFASVLFLVACICFILWRRTWRRRAKAPEPTDSLHVNDHRPISYHELSRATNNFNEVNLLGRGGFGSVYKGRLDDGLSIAVKVLNLETEGASRSFDVECRTLRMLRHRNLVKIITTCSNLDFKALVLQFMPGGSLEKSLYSHNYFLSLLQRMSIMIDVALALEYLHDHHVVHCDLKPSNVLLDQNMTAHVADFGIAKLLVGDSKFVASMSAPGTVGYMAPEYGSTGRVSKRSDVYSYGILMLETFTRMKPTDGPFNGNLTLRQWVNEAHPVTVMEIVDNNLLRDEYNNVQPNWDNSAKLRCLLDVIELGLLCSRDFPKERISMKDVVTRLEKIRKEYLSKLPSA